MPSSELGVVASEIAHGRNTWFRYALADLTQAKAVSLYWDLNPNTFTPNDPPFVFSVLRATEFTSDITAYTEIITDLIDTYSYTDTSVPSIGKWPHYYYIIKLDTNLRTVYSPPITLYGGLTVKQRAYARGIIRRALLSPRHVPHFSCILLKRKHSGTPCSCIDSITKEILKPDCTACYGTGFAGGYYQEGSEKPLIVNSPLNSIETVDISTKVGSMTPAKMAVRFSGLPPVRHNDVFVHVDTNRRFYVVSSKVAAEIHGFPLIQELELQLADYKDVIYKFSLEG